MTKWWLSIAIVSATACGGSSVSVNDLTKEYVKSYCEYQVRCGYAPDAKTCEASITLDNNDFLTAVDGVDMGKIDYDSGAAGDCLDAVAGQSCNFEGFHDNSQQACGEIFTGKTAQGGACFTNFECAGGASCVATDSNCDSSTTCCPGTCGAPATTVASGGACGDNDTCADGTYCKPPASGSGDGVCTAYVTMEGAACDAFEACANPMICDIFLDMPVCEKPAAAGATCNPDALLPCVDLRQHCDMTSMKCVDALADGGACMSSSECKNGSSCVNMVCTADLKAGAACMADMGADCMGDLECTNGTCALPPTGMSCL
jgi:hypothetical protein